jgi:hypothetical protein
MSGQLNHRRKDGQANTFGLTRAWKFRFSDGMTASKIRWPVFAALRRGKFRLRCATPWQVPSSLRYAVASSVFAALRRGKFLKVAF